MNKVVEEEIAVAMTEDQSSLDVKKEKLIEAAGQVFAEFGFQGATMREICLRAGANMATLNYYFGGKLGPDTTEAASVGDSTGKAIAAAVAVTSTVTVIGLLILGQAVVTSGSGQRLLAAVMCDILALGAYTASFRLSRQGAQRSVIAYGILGGALLIAGTLCALSVAG